MLVSLPYGRHRLQLDVDPARCPGVFHGPPPLDDPVATLRQALESPLRFPPLRRALTPDDHLVVAVDEALPRLGELLTVVLEHITSAGVSPAALTVLCPPPVSAQAWVDELPDEFGDVHIEDHDPANRQALAYLATSQSGRRIYLNRTLVDADQIVVLGLRGYDLVQGYGGAEAALYPTFGDEETRARLGAAVTVEAPTEVARPAHAEAVEVAWLLGQPFYVQGIRAAGGGLAHLVAGASDAAREGQHLLDACWRHRLSSRAETVVVAVSGESGFAELAAAAGAAARVVVPGGRIVILSEATGEPPAGFEELLRGDDAAAALVRLEKAPRAGWGPALQWAHAVTTARVSLLSALPSQTVEDLFATPLESPGQVQRLIATGGSAAFFEDAQHMLAVLG